MEEGGTGLHWGLRKRVCSQMGSGYTPFYSPCPRPVFLEHKITQGASHALEPG